MNNNSTAVEDHVIKRVRGSTYTNVAVGCAFSRQFFKRTSAKLITCVAEGLRATDMHGLKNNIVIVLDEEYLHVEH